MQGTADGFCTIANGLSIAARRRWVRDGQGCVSAYNAPSFDFWLRLWSSGMTGILA